MTEVAPPPPPVSTSPLSDERQTAMLVYLCYLGAFALAPLNIVGLVLAYINRDAAPDWLKSHYTFQIRTFWIGLLFGFVSFPLCFVGVGFLLLLVTMIWFVVRCAVGLDRLMKREAYPTPDSWIV
jgi:uncharacterized membrane protein